MIADVLNLMRQRALLFKWLEVAETMRAYIAHNIDDNEELQAKMETVEGKLVVTRQIIDEEVELLRKAEEGKEVAEAEARRLAEEKKVMEAKHKKVDEENEQLSQEIQELRVGFVVQKEELKGEYKKQVDEMFFFNY